MCLFVQQQHILHSRCSSSSCPSMLSLLGGVLQTWRAEAIPEHLFTWGFPASCLRTRKGLNSRGALLSIHSGCRKLFTPLRTDQQAGRVLLGLSSRFPQAPLFLCFFGLDPLPASGDVSSLFAKPIVLLTAKRTLKHQTSHRNPCENLKILHPVTWLE